MGSGCRVQRIAPLRRGGRTALLGATWQGLLAFGLCGAPTLAQSGTEGAIGGRVLSASGAPVAGALVVARAIDTGLAVHRTSGSRGEFLLARLPAGEYTLTVEDFGSLMALPAPVGVGLGEVTEVEARMRPPSTQPSIVDDSGAVTSEQDGALITDTQLASLPVDGGEWRSLALTSSSVNPAAGADDSAGEISAGGVAVVQNDSRVDGTSGDQNFSGMRAGAGIEEDAESGADEVQDPAAGVGSGAVSVASGGRRAGSAYTFAQAAVREFRVAGQADAAGYGSALYGHGVGGVISTVSRSGGVSLHGMGFYTVRASAWAAADPLSVATNYVNGVVTSGLVKPSDLRQQFGGRIGGPVPMRWFTRGKPVADAQDRSRLFYFYAFDAQRRSFPAISSPGYAGFYTLTATQTALLGNRGVSAAQTMTALNYLDSLSGTVPRRADQDVNFGRLDWQRHGGSRAVIEYNRARWSSPAGARSSPVVDRGLASLGSSFGKVDLGVVRWVQTMRNGWSDETRMQLSRQLQYETTQTPLPQEPAIGPGGLPPEVSIGPDGFVFGTPAALGRKAYPDERRLELSNVANWVHGRHFVQVGADLSAINIYTDSLTNAEGTFSYDSGAVNGKAGGLVDWITDYTYDVHAYPNGGCPSIVSPTHDFCFRSYSQAFGQQSLQFSTQEWAAFLQDDWRAAARLTIHLGLRYEYQFLPLPQTPNAGLDAVFGASGATSVYPEDRNNLGPRLGVAWEPFGAGRGLLRLGYGVYYGKLPGATVRAALLDTALPLSTTRIRILPHTETVCPQMPTVGFGYACSYLAPPSGVVASTTSAVVFDHRFRLPAIQQATLSAERRLFWGMLGAAHYVMNLDRQLPDSVDINIAPATSSRTFQLQGGTGAIGVRDGETFAVPFYSGRISPSFGPVTDIVSNANATYNGLTLELRRGLGTGLPFSGGIGRSLEFRLAWTWSKAIDFGQSSGATPRTNGQFDPFTNLYDKGLSSLNFPHREVATVVWSPRAPAWTFGDGHLQHAARIAASGWSVGSIFYEASGRGYSYDIFGGSRLPGGHESINGSGGSRVLPTVGRNTLRLPDRANLDLRLSRIVSLDADRLRLRAAAEIFNATNHVNYSGIQQRAFLTGKPVNGVTPLVFQDAATVAAEGLNVLPFGTFTAARTSQSQQREMQLSLRLEF